MVFFDTLRACTRNSKNLCAMSTTPPSSPEVLSFGSVDRWRSPMASFVTADSTREALDMARHVIIDHYIAETVRLIGTGHVHASHRCVRRPRQRTRGYEKQLAKDFSWKQITSAEPTPLPRVSDRRYAYPQGHQNTTLLQVPQNLKRISASSRKPLAQTTSALAELVRPSTQVQTFGSICIHSTFAQHARIQSRRSFTWHLRGSPRPKAIKSPADISAPSARLLETFRAIGLNKENPLRPAIRHS